MMQIGQYDKIPNILKERGIKFVLLEKSGKKPFQKEWQNKFIEFDSPELINHIRNGGNYGVMGGGEKNLVIFDFDNEGVQEIVCQKLPPTFTVKTGSGKLHKYFFSDKCNSFKIFDEDSNTLIDLQGEGKQVVGPGSTHPNGNIYEVVDCKPIAFINYSEIQALLLPLDKKPKKENKEVENPRGIITETFADRIKSQVSMKQLLEVFGINTSKNPTNCLFHSSKGGKCLGFNNETAHCFHCEGSWNIFSFVKDAKSCSFPEALEFLANRFNFKEEFELDKKYYKQSIVNEEEAEILNIRSKFLSLISEKPSKWADATELLVDYIKKKNYIYTTKDDLKSEVWFYKEGAYVPQGKSEIKIILRIILDKWYTQYIYGLVLSKIEADTFIDTDTFFKTNYVDEVPVKNGILNVISGELKPFSPDRVFFNKMPVTYDPKATCPQIEKFLDGVLAKEEDKKVFYEIGGACLLGEYRFEKATILVGDGRNGKDKSLELIKRLLGAENCCAIPLHSLEQNSFAISELFGKKANIAADIGNQDLKDSSIFKALTGRSLISGKRKFLKDIIFVNSAKLIFACNNLPIVYDLTKGFWARWVLLEYPYTFVTKEEFDSAENKKNLKIKDPEIIEKITSAQEMSGLLNKCIEGLKRLVVQGDFSSTKGSEEIKTLWVRKSNSFIAFCMDKIEQAFDKKISKRELRKEYADYCRQHKIGVKSDIVIKKVLLETYGAGESQSTFQLGDFVDRFWEGITWKK